MKKQSTILACILMLYVCSHAQVKIGGAPGTPPVSSAVLELDGGNNRGLLLPRMRTMDIFAIQNPAEGLTIYATDEQAVYLRKSLAWEKQGPLTLPYTNTSNALSAFTIINNGFKPAIGIRGYSIIGTGVLGSSDAEYGVSGIAGTTSAIGGYFEGRGGTALLCQGRMDLFDEDGALIRLAGADTVYRGFIQLFGSDTKIGTLANNNVGRFIIRTNGTDRLHVNPNGRIIIGSAAGTEPAGNHLLKVKGSIQATDFTATALASWPDYVFDPSYKLRSLEETEAFIKEHKHLPNIPAAAVVEKEGFALGDMQKRMMEKIEELTLYLIEANKSIKQQQIEIDLLKRKSARPGSED